MRYRAFTLPEDFSRDLATSIDLIGESEYRGLLDNIGRGLNFKGYVTRLDDLRFSLELQLFNLELLRQKHSGRFPAVPLIIHEAVDFIIGLGQTIPHLSLSAQKKLCGQVVGGLKTNSLRPLQHELRVATAVSKLGFDVTFADLEGNGGYDLLAERAEESYEVEAKAAEVFSGRPILPQKAQIFFDEVRRGFNRWSDKDSIPILDIVLKSNLATRRPEVLALVEACNAAASTKTEQSVGGNAAVHFAGTIAGVPLKRLQTAALHYDQTVALHYDEFFNVYVPQKVLIRLRSERKDKFEKKIIDTISEACKKQFSGTRPAVIWVHIDYVNPDSFKALSSAKQGMSSRLGFIANNVFRSSERDHIVQLVFSGGAHLKVEGGLGRSSFNSTVYNAPSSRFGKAILFPGGKTRHPAQLPGTTGA
jgi:phenylpyruvate tautomerase PptA (4-oxalocrotonate tautomerase family)